MVFRETVSDHVPYPPATNIHLVSYPLNTKLFRHLKQKLIVFLIIFWQKSKLSPLEQAQIVLESPGK